MGLFKRFTETRQASKAELEGFKARLKYGDDPKLMYDTYREHYDQYVELKKQTNDLLVRGLDVELSDEMHNWTTLEIQDYDFFGEKGCPDSPVGKHVYLHHYGKLNPKRGSGRHCVCCERKL